MGCIFTKEKEPILDPPKKEYSWDVRAASNLDFQHYQIENVKNNEIIRFPGSINGQQFLIQNCENATIMLLDFINSVIVDECENCTIVLGAVKGSVNLRNCQNVTCITACGQFRTRDCRKCVMFINCETQPIIEASTNMKFGTYQLSYEKLDDQLKDAGLNLSITSWSEVYDFTPVPCESNWTFIDIAESKFKLKARTKRVENAFKKLNLTWMGKEPLSVALETMV